MTKRRRLKKRSSFRGYAALALVGLIVVVVSYGAVYQKSPDQTANIDRFAGLTAQIYYSPTCGCCKQYADYLKDYRFRVMPVETEDMQSVKNSFGIPSSTWSCHTVTIGDYFVEGHVPIEAVEKLLREKPQVNGITLPGMPAGSPGMGGTKTHPFVIYSISDENLGEFTKV